MSCLPDPKLMVKPPEENINNICDYDKKHISRDRSVLYVSTVVESCPRFLACVVPLLLIYTGDHRTEGPYQAMN